MNNQRGQRIVRGQRFSASDILQIEGRAVRHPGAGLLRSVIASGGNRGSQQTGAWVADGTTFYLQDVTGGKPLTADNTLAALIVHLQR